MLQSVDRIAGSLAAFWTTNIRITYLIGSIQAVAIPRDTPEPQSVVAGDDEQRESGNGFFNHV